MSLEIAPHRIPTQSATAPFGITHLFLTVEVLALDLLSTGYFIRGAIVKGDLYHDDKMVFGPALVHAYNLERAVVDYPRIMLPYNLFKDAQAIWGMQYKEYMRQANDGPFFIHFLLRFDALVAVMDICEPIETDSSIE